MIKNYGFAAIFFASSAMTAYNAVPSAGTKTDHLPLPDALAAHAEEINTGRKDRWGEARLERAFVRGNTIIIDLIVQKAPTQYDVRASNARLQSLMEGRFCNSRVTPLLRRGAGLVFRYSTPGGRALMDGRVDASSCKLT